MVFILTVLSTYTCNAVCGSSKSKGRGCVSYYNKSGSLNQFSGDATHSSGYGLSVLWIGSYLIEERGSHSIRFTIQSETDEYPNPLLKLTIGETVFTESDFLIKTYASSGLYYVNATFTTYLLKGTYVYLKFNHETCTRCKTYITVASGSGSYKYLSGSNLWPCDGGDACEDESVNPGQFCLPYTYAPVNNLLFNDVAKKSLMLGALFALI